MRKFNLKLLRVLTVFFVLNILLGSLLIITFRSQYWDEFNNSGDSEYSVVFTGSSLMGFGMIPEIVDSAADVNSYNLATPAQSPKTCYIVSKYILKTHKPKTLVVEFYWKNANVGDQFVNQIIPFAQFKPNRESASIFLDDFTAKDKLRALFIPTWFIKDMRRVLRSGHISRRKRVVDDSKGYLKSLDFFDRTKYSELHINTSNEKFDFVNAEQINYMDSLVDLCRNTETNLIMLTFPLPKRVTEADPNQYLAKAFYEDYAARNGVQYLNFSKESLVDTFHFKDAEHLNWHGAKRCSQVLGQMIMSAKKDE